MNKSESIVEISKALAKFQGEVKQPLKDADNPYFKSKYVPLENVVESISSIAPNHGLSFVQWALNDENGRVGVATMLMHESGEFIEFDPVFINAEKQTPQGAGSLITYLKRYSLSAVFGITSDQDDDANESSGNNQNDQNNNKNLSEAQVKRLFAIGKSVQVTAADIKKVIMNDYNKTDVALLTKKEYDEVCNRLESKKES
ncbi:ERF family protein [Oceanobacillus oncorhynchi]|uniref:ERF family protein n=1 Tax=Oceanobacillus oncorhynchi TaxID=545501 RepID=UPI0025A46310|nr:ERF family protein [Oceanobacillus oncorhynchi]MDM8098694.1 ERF family protein [Oceanobacillus oncorhynchi]